jgi:hypothetical protein
MLNRPRIRQLSLGELLDESFSLYRSNVLTFMAIAALVLVPYTLLSFITQYPFQDRLQAIQNASNGGSNPFIGQSAFDLLGEMLFWYLLIAGVSMLYMIVFQPLLEGTLAHSIAQHHLGREASVGESFGAALRRSPALILARLLPFLVSSLIGALIVGGSAALVLLLLGQRFSEELEPTSIAALVGFGILGIGLVILLLLIALALMIRIMFTSQTIIVENAGPWQSLVRSWRLTEGSFWRIVGYLLVIGLLISTLIALPTIVISVIITLLGLDPRVQLLINTCANAVISVITTPFSMIAYTLLYFDLRVRKEGFDLEHQASTLLPSISVSAFESR